MFWMWLKRLMAEIYVLIWNALAPEILRRKSPEEEAADREHEKEGGLRPNQDHR